MEIYHVTDSRENRIGNNWESQFAVNHLGHSVLTTALLPMLLNADGARVVCLSSVAHRRSDILWDDINFESSPYEKWTAYAQAKTAKAMFKSTTQGCSTSLWAATSEVLADTGGLYCEDCDVANLATEESPGYFDVAPWAASEDGAMRLWDLTEEMLA